MRSIITFCFILFFTFSVQAQIDRTQQPKPGPAPLIQLEDPEEFELENGMTVLLVENHKLPRVSISLSIDHPLIVESEKVGANSLLGSMMGKGSTSISKNDFEEEIDFMGARLYFNSSGVQASSLSRYFPKVLELMADATLNPNFVEEEFQKEKEKLITGLETAEKDVKTAARRVENILSYGPNHPYGEYISKEKVKNLSLVDIEKAYDYIYSSLNSYLVVVGDFDPNQTRKLITKYFGNWKAKEQPKIPFKDPTNAEQTEIAFVEMSNAVQSEISFINTVQLDKKSDDYFASLLANQILGGGGEARLFLNLREDKGFTYGAYSSLGNSHKTKARFRASTSVRNAVTDSAVVEILHEVDKIRNELVTDEELDLVKAKYAGNFIISLENPETIADFTLNIKTQNLPSNFYKEFLKNINKVTKQEVLAAANKYILSNNARIVVTGKGSEILDGLEKISHQKPPLKVRYFDKWGTEIKRPDYSKATPEGITSAIVIDQYLEAIGGRSTLEGIQTIKENSKAEVQGMVLEVFAQKTNQKQALTEMKMMGNVMQKQVVNKDYAYMEMQGQKIDMEGAVLAQMLDGAAIFPELNLDINSVELLGIVDLDGNKAYEIKVSEGLINYYDVENHLKVQVSQTMELMGNSQTTIIKMGDYKAVDGILFPHKSSMSLGPQELDLITQSIELNSTLDPSIFN
jgi:predicted Zn-dependent peptidase